MNRLSKESSPYLKQHQSNPVDWYPWGSEAFEASRNENKPIFLSIGYATCYWCHVMEKDSFEHQEVGDALKDFIAIKVDREERPDVDEIYMDAVVSMRGQGGWPMSVFLTPDLKPFWAGTFFYKKDFLNILSQVSAAWKSEKDDIISSSEKLTAYLKEKESIFAPAPLKKAALQDAMLLQLSKSFDANFGGFGKAPKFPPSQQIRTLLTINSTLHDATSKEISEKTLDAMAKGGIYDHVGGGFSRYSVDAEWRVPHFEKMLYDNALLLETYAEAFIHTQKQEYKALIYDVFNFLKREMKRETFISALDAGEVDKEGEFYVWKYSELEEILTVEEFNSLSSVFEISETGNFEGNIVLHLKSALIDKIKIKVVLDKLFVKRELREKPHVDYKSITHWNALLANSFFNAYRATLDAEFLNEGNEILDFIITKQWDGSTLKRIYCDGIAHTAGCLDDYASFIRALISSYEVTGNEKRLVLALEVLKVVNDKFLDSDLSGYFSSTADELPLRKKDFFDDAIPCGNSLMLENLLKISSLYPTKENIEAFESLSCSFGGILSQYPHASSFATNVILRSEYQVLCFKTDKKDEVFLNLSKKFMPSVVLCYVSGSDAAPVIVQGKESASESLFLCSFGECKKPVSSFDELWIA